MCAQKRQLKMKETRQTKSVCVVADEEEPSEEGQQMNQTSLYQTCHLNLVVSRIRVRVCVQTKARTKVRARERKDEDEEA